MIVLTMPMTDAVIKLTWIIMSQVWKLYPCQNIGIILEYYRSYVFKLWAWSHNAVCSDVYVLHAKVNINLKWYSLHNQNGCLYF